MAPLAAQEAPLAAEGDQPRVGAYLRIPAPLSTELLAQIRDTVDRVVTESTQAGLRPILVLEFEPGPNAYGTASELAKYLSGPALAGASTVAYVPRTITGHTVLVALACGEIVMADDAEIGDAGRDDAEIAADVRAGYVFIANRRRTIAPDLALGMLDKSLEVWTLETNFGNVYALSDRVAELKKTTTVTAERVLKPAGSPGRFTGVQARELGFVSYLAKDLPSVARRLRLPPDSLGADRLQFQRWRPMLIEVEGPITPRLATRVQRLIDVKMRDADVNFVCLKLESEGGSPEDSGFLAMYLAKLSPERVRTLAWAPGALRGDALLIAAACDEIAVGPEARLGGQYPVGGRFELTSDLAQLLTAICRDKGRSYSLWRAMIEADAPVFRWRRAADGQVQFFASDELAEQHDAAAWQQQAAVTRPGEFLEVTGPEAVSYGLASEIVDGLPAVRARYGLTDELAEIELTWVDELLEALSHDTVAGMLLLIAGAGLYVELHSPGIGLGGVIAALCFLIFFWAKFLGGTAGWLEVLMFGAGVVFLLIELVALPGFGLFGVVGTLLVLASLVLASQTFVIPATDYEFGVLRDSLSVVALAGAGVVVFAVAARRWLPHTPLFGSLVLQPPEGREREQRARREQAADYSELVGRTARTITKLMPSGKIRLDGEALDVLTEGDAIEAGVEVRIVEVRAHRILVRRLTA